MHRMRSLFAFFFSSLFHPYSQSESSLHSLFLWPQSCTCLLRADPETERGSSMLGSISPASWTLYVGHMREEHKSKGDGSRRREQETEEGGGRREGGVGCVNEVAPTDDSPDRSPSDWLPPPSPLGETRPWRPAAACWGDWTTWTTDEICRRNKNRKHWVTLCSGTHTRRSSWGRKPLHLVRAESMSRTSLAKCFLCF